MVQVHGPGDIRLDPVTPPVAGPRDAIVRIKACGICGTDLTFIKLGGLGQGPKRPLPLGHEAAGEIVSVGKDVHHLRPGQRVAINPIATNEVIGNGGPEGAFTEELLVRDAAGGDALLLIPDELPYDIAALTEPLGVAMHGVNRSNAKPGEKVVIFGCGPIGLGALMWLKDRGVDDVVAVDVAPERLERAKALGARATIRAGHDDLRARLGELHGVESLLGRDVVGTNVYLDFAAAPTIVPDVIDMARKHARLVITGVYSQPVQIDLRRMLASELTITTAISYPDELPEVIAALPRLQATAASLISHRVPFEEVLGAFDTARNADSAKVMIEFAD